MTSEHPHPQPAALVLYGSRHGHTAKIAGRIAGVLGEAGIEVDLRDIEHADELVPGAYEGVVLAGSVHQGKHAKELVAFAERHHTLLNELPTAFVSVSLTAADDTEESASETRRMIDEFLDETGLVPAVTEPVAGCLQYREYDFMTRLIMRMITRKHSDPEAQDVHRDHEYTDWDRLEAFARDFAQRLVKTPA